jgi:hypothetical protein
VSQLYLGLWITSTITTYNCPELPPADRCHRTAQAWHKRDLGTVGCLAFGRGRHLPRNLPPSSALEAFEQLGHIIGPVFAVARFIPLILQLGVFEDPAHTFQRL